MLICWLLTVVRRLLPDRLWEWAVRRILRR